MVKLWLQGSTKARPREHTQMRGDEVLLRKSLVRWVCEPNIFDLLEVTIAVQRVQTSRGPDCEHTPSTASSPAGCLAVSHLSQVSGLGAV